MAEVRYYLSGGPDNTDAAYSLGGLPSVTPVGVGTNVLFAGVTATEAADGGSRYRCVYAANESGLELTAVAVSLAAVVETLSTTAVGVEVRDEVQRVVIGGSPTGGDFALVYEAVVGGVLVVQTTAPIVWTAVPAKLAGNIQTALNALTYIAGGVAVASETAKGSFRVTFGGGDGGRAHRLLAATDVALPGATGVTVARVTGGAPINAVAADIGFENQAPDGVTFSTAAATNRLLPGDVFGLWVRRQTPPFTVGYSMDTNGADVVVGYLIVTNST